MCRGFGGSGGALASSVGTCGRHSPGTGQLLECNFKWPLSPHSCIPQTEPFQRISSFGVLRDVIDCRGIFISDNCFITCSRFSFFFLSFFLAQLKQTDEPVSCCHQLKFSFPSPCLVGSPHQSVFRLVVVLIFTASYCMHKLHK